MPQSGATVPEIAALTGHSETTVQELLRVYLPHDPMIADAGMSKRGKYRKGTESAQESEN